MTAQTKLRWVKFGGVLKARVEPVRISVLTRARTGVQEHWSFDITADETQMGFTGEEEAMVAAEEYLRAWAKVVLETLGEPEK